MQTAEFQPIDIWVAFFPCSFCTSAAERMPAFVPLRLV